MTSELLEYAIIYRFQQPLAAFLLYLNTAAAVFGYLKPRVILTGFSLFLLMQLAYIFDGRFKSEEDIVNLPSGENAGRKIGLWPIFLLAALPITYILSSPGLWPLILIAFVLIPAYSNPAMKSWRLKALPFLKPFVNVTGFWSVGILAPVLLKYPLSAALLAELAKSSLSGIIFFFCLTVLLDIRDVEGDRVAGLRTFPVSAGIPLTVAGLVLLLAGTGLAGYWKGDRNAICFSIFLIPCVGASLKFKSRLYYEGVFAVTNLYLAGSLFHR